MAATRAGTGGKTGKSLNRRLLGLSVGLALLTSACTPTIDTYDRDSFEASYAIVKKSQPPAEQAQLDKAMFALALNEVEVNDDGEKPQLLPDISNLDYFFNLIKYHIEPGRQWPRRPESFKRLPLNRQAASMARLPPSPKKSVDRFVFSACDAQLCSKCGG